MKGFIVLLCTVGAALAAPQYNYSPGQSGSFSSNTIGGSHSSGGSHGGGGSHSSGGGGGFSTGGLIGTGGGSSGGSFSQSFNQQNFQQSSSGFGVSGAGVSNAGQQQAIITKQFFIHSAPQEQDEVGADKVINLGPGRKHYRVVFIKAPHQGVQSGKVRFVAPANEEKTVIYVLSKKTDSSDIQADVQQAQSEPTKPEVHFIKYKTNEEALHAQRQIQAQYDQLGGTSQVSDEGVAPISSVIGALGDGQSSGGQSSGGLISGTTSQFSGIGDGSGASGSFVGGGLGGSHSGGHSGGGSHSHSSGGAPATSYLPPRK